MSGVTAEDAVKLVLDAAHIIVITGAGVSAAAGIPTFTGLDSVGTHFEGTRVRDVMSNLIRGSVEQGEQHWRFIRPLATKAIAAKPTQFHYMLKFLESANKLTRIYTQNIDGLESKAGFDLLDQSLESRCILLHGTLADTRCSRCSAVNPLEHSFHLVKSGALPTCPGAERAIPTLRPRTGKCGSLFPDIALYEDPVKEEDLIKSAVNADAFKIAPNTLLLVAGTSLRIPGVVDIIGTLLRHVTVCGGHTVYVDVKPDIPQRLEPSLKVVLPIDCQVFATMVIDGMRAYGLKEMVENSDLREDMRPFWDWE